MPVTKGILLILTALFSTSSQATTGIDSVGYLWVLALVMLGIMGLAVWLLRFLRRIRNDSKKYEQKQDE